MIMRFFRGFLSMLILGQSVKMNDYMALANVIKMMSGQRAELKMYSRYAREFAKQHLFEKNFSNRINHLKEISDLNTPSRELYATT
jgi:hypothetical protein